MKRLRIVLTGMIASEPYQGGATWAVLQYLIGLRKLGHDVCFIEPISPGSVQPEGVRLANSANTSYFTSVVRGLPVGGLTAIVVAGSRETWGASYERIQGFVDSADLLLNISGLLVDDSLFRPIPVRAYLDLDPAFNQLWQAVEHIDRHFDGHTHFVTVGALVGTPHSPIPTCGLTWIPTLQPVVLDEWPAVYSPPINGITTVTNWRGYGSIEWNGTLFGQKVHSFRELMPLPVRTGETFRVAVALHPGEQRDRDALEKNNWLVLNPYEVAGTPERYRAFIQGSEAEIGIAKSGYVKSRSGWFSDRSACYLASARPVIAQNTGFTVDLPTGIGLLAFDSLDEAVEAVARMKADYRRHAHAARHLAEEHFESSKVLTRLIEQLAVTS